jgi:predicted DNA-binding transcriptional regulator AlpA
MQHNTRDPLRALKPQGTHDSLLCIEDIRAFFKLGRTAAYELTHRPDFPAPVVISPRCYRWWASEVTTFAVGMRCELTLFAVAQYVHDGDAEGGAGWV